MLVEYISINQWDIAFCIHPPLSPDKKKIYPSGERGMKREIYTEIKRLTNQIDENLTEQDTLDRDDIRYWQLQRRNRDLISQCKKLVLAR